MRTKTMLFCLIATTLIACDSGVDVTSSETLQFAAANDHPCAQRFVYHEELIGNPTDTRKTSKVVDGETLFEEAHWHPEFEMIQYYIYAENGHWCNNWTESGVSWE